MYNTGTVNFLNLEWWFRLIYDLIFGAHSLGAPGLGALLTHVWVWVTVVGSIIAILALGVIVYATVRLFELRAREAEGLGPLPILAKDGAENPRWAHIKSLISGSTASEWKEAILEADILLDEMLSRQGYKGVSVGDKLKQVERSDFDTLDAAWEAHLVRNDIAHRGSTSELTEAFARRTISKYESVFREFDMI